MHDLFSFILFGHLVGDYLLQPEWMALHKTDKGLPGCAMCWYHCIIYGVAMTLFLGAFLNPLLVFWVAVLSHFFIDRFSLGQKWLDAIGGRNVLRSTRAKKYKNINVSFSCIVYTVVDNTFHLLVLWLPITLGVLR